MLNIIGILSVSIATWTDDCSTGKHGIKSFLDKGFCSNVRLSSFSVLPSPPIPQLPSVCVIVNAVFVEKEITALVWTGVLVLDTHSVSGGVGAEKAKQSAGRQCQWRSHKSRWPCNFNLQISSSGRFCAKIREGLPHILGQQG